MSIVLPVIPLIGVLLILVILDLITALIAARRLKIQITSKKLRQSAGKLTGYIIILIAGSFLDELIGLRQGFGISVTKFMAGFLAVVEVLSIGENLSPILGINYFRIALKFLVNKYFKGSTATWEETMLQFYQHKKDDLLKQKIFVSKKMLDTTIKLTMAESRIPEEFKKGVWYEFSSNDSIGLYTRVIHKEDDFLIFQSYFLENSRHRANPTVGEGYFYVKSGEMVLKYDGEKIRVQEGQYYAVPNGKDVWYMSEESAEILFMYTDSKEHFYKLTSFI